MDLLFDIGGTNMRIAVCEDGTTLKDHRKVPTPKAFEEGVEMLERISRELLGNKSISGIAGGIVGPLNRERTHIVNAPNLPEWNGKPFKEELEQRFAAPVLLENDASVAGLGEATQGAGKNKEIVAYFTVGTGVGGALVVNGKLVPTAWDFEPGQQIIDIRDAHTLEQRIAGPAVLKRFGVEPSTITDQKIWDTLARELAFGLHNTIVHWSPDIVVLGGSMILKQPGIPLKNVQQHLRTILRIFPDPPPLLEAKLGDDSGLIGALALLRYS